MNSREPTAYQRHVIRVADELRGAIIGRYAEVEFFLGDIVVRCQALPEYAALPDSFPYKPSKRPGRVRQFLGLPGPLSAYKEALERTMSELEVFEELRHFLVHGHQELTTRADRWHQLSYNLYREQDGRYALFEIKTNLESLEARRTEIACLAQVAVSLMSEIYLQHGLEGGR